MDLNTLLGVVIGTIVAVAVIVKIKNIATIIITTTIITISSVAVEEEVL